MSRRLPDSMMSRGLAKLDGFDIVGQSDFIRALTTVCGSKESARGLANQMQKNGIYRTMVVLTDKGKAAIEAAKRVRGER